MNIVKKLKNLVYQKKFDPVKLNRSINELSADCLKFTN